jgi:phospholipid/cholesterol/gamma-HCH transport system substrate-binding protein
VKISNETKVGILATFAIVIVILGVNFLKGKNVFSRNIILYAKYPDVQNLSASNPVILHGLQVGQVDAEELIVEGENRVLVKFHIDGDVKIPNNSTAKIISSDLLGSKALVIIPGTGREVAMRNDTLKGEVEVSLTESISKVVAPVQKKVEKLIGSVDTIMTGLNEVFNANTREDLRLSFASIKGSLTNLEATTGTLNTFINDETGRIKDVVSDVQKISENLKNNNEAITRAINNFASISDSLRAANLKQTLTEVHDVVAQVNTLVDGIQKGEGSMGKLLKDDKLYANLESASKNLDKLVADLKANPGRYVNFSLLKINRTSKAPADTTK